MRFLILALLIPSVAHGAIYVDRLPPRENPADWLPIQHVEHVPDDVARIMAYDDFRQYIHVSNNSTWFLRRTTPRFRMVLGGAVTEHDVSAYIHLPSMSLEAWPYTGTPLQPQSVPVSYNGAPPVLFPATRLPEPGGLALAACGLALLLSWRRGSLR